MGVAEWAMVLVMVVVLAPFTFLLRSALGRIQWLREDVAALKSRVESATRDRNHIRDTAHRDRAAFLVSHRELLRVFEQRVSSDAGADVGAEDGYMEPAEPAEPEDGVDREPAEPEDMMRLAQAADPSSRDIHQHVANRIMRLGRRDGLSGRSNAMTQAFAMNYGSSVHRTGVDAQTALRGFGEALDAGSSEELPRTRLDRLLGDDDG